MKKNVFLVFVSALFALAFVSCDFETASHVTTDDNNKEDGYEGGACLPGDICAEGLECIQGICEKETAVDDTAAPDTDTTVADDNIMTDTDTTTPVACTLSPSECVGMEMYLPEIPAKVVLFGKYKDENGKIENCDVFPEGKVLVADNYIPHACAGIAYRADGSIITPSKCVGIEGNETCYVTSCKGGDSGTDDECIANCDPNKCTDD